MFEEWIGWFFWGLDEGLILTLKTLGISIITTFIWGILIALMRTSNNVVLNRISTAYIETFRSTPILLQFIVVYALLPQLINVFIPAFAVAILVITLNAGTYMAEGLRAGYESVPIGIIEASTSLGMTQANTFRRVRFPIMMSITFPAIGNVIIQLVLTTPFVFLVGIQDLMSKAHELMTRVADFSVYLVVTVIYVIIGLVISWLNKKIEGRIRLPGY